VCACGSSRTLDDLGWVSAVSPLHVEDLRMERRAARKREAFLSNGTSRADRRDASFYGGSLFGQ
jgi:hypothetical protein